MEGVMSMQSVRAFAQRITEHDRFARIVLWVIGFNFVVLSLETYPAVMTPYGTLLVRLDLLCLVFFVVEITLKFIAQVGREFFRSWMNVFDLVIVLVSLPFVPGNFSALRAFRILRVFYLKQEFREIIAALVAAWPRVKWALYLLGVVIGVCSLFISKYLAGAGPGLSLPLHDSIKLHFQLMLFDNWGDVTDQLMAAGGSWLQWYTKAYAIITLIINTLIIGLLFDGVTRALRQQT